MLHHRGHKVLTQQPGSFQICIQHSVPLIHGGFVIGFIELGARIIDQHIDHAPARQYLLRSTPNRGLLPDIQFQRKRLATALARKPLSRDQVSIQDTDICPLTDKSSDSSGTDATGTAGNHTLHIFQSHNQPSVREWS